MRPGKITIAIVFIALVLIVFLVNFPIIVMILNSFKSNSEIISSTRILPQHVTLGNYIALGNNSKMLVFIKNSLIVTVIGTGISILISALAGFVLSRFRSAFITGYSRFLLMIQMFPLILTLIPLFILFRKLDIVNTYFSVIIIYIAIGLPFSTWMFKGFFDSVPKELEEASWIDGCSKTQSFLRIVLPISGPGIIAVAIYSFLLCWNEYMIANVFLRKNDLMTIPVGIQMFVQQFSTDWGSLMSAATIAMLPAFIIFLFFQKYMVSGMVAGSVKG